MGLRVCFLGTLGWYCSVGLGSCFCLGREGECYVPIAPLPPCICPYPPCSWFLPLHPFLLHTPFQSGCTPLCLPLIPILWVRLYPPAGLSHEWEPSEVLSVGMPHHWVSRGSGCRELMWAMPLPSGGGGSVFLEQAGSRCPRCHPQDRAQDDRSQKPHHLPRRW